LINKTNKTNKQNKQIKTNNTKQNKQTKQNKTSETKQNKPRDLDRGVARKPSHRDFLTSRVCGGWGFPAGEQASTPI